MSSYIEDNVVKAYPASEIAKYFISKSTPGTNQNVTNLKLQKLLYYAQGFYYSLNNRKLFSEQIYAWAHGPVVKEIYHQYKKYNFNEITNENRYKSQNFINISNKDKLFLDKVWDTFKNFSGKQLEYLTHKETPWKNNYVLGEYNTEIEIDEIRKFFTENYLKNKIELQYN